MLKKRCRNSVWVNAVRDYLPRLEEPRLHRPERHPSDQPGTEQVVREEDTRMLAIRIARVAGGRSLSMGREVYRSGWRQAGRRGSGGGTHRIG